MSVAVPISAQTLHPVSFCQATVGLGTPIPQSTEYAFALQSTEGHSELSGVLSVYAGNERYDVHFADVTAAPMGHLDTATPIVVRFPKAVDLDFASVASLDPDRACLPFVTRVTPEKEPSPDAASLLKRAQAIEPADSSAPAALPEPACSPPYKEVTLAKGAYPRMQFPQFEALQRLNTMLVEERILTYIDEDGHVLSVYPLNPSPEAAINTSSLEALRESTFIPAMFRCESIGGIYVFYVRYEGH